MQGGRQGRREAGKEAGREGSKERGREGRMQVGVAKIFFSSVLKEKRNLFKAKVLFSYIIFSFPLVRWCSHVVVPCVLS